MSQALIIEASETGVAEKRVRSTTKTLLLFLVLLLSLLRNEGIPTVVGASSLGKNRAT